MGSGDQVVRPDLKPASDDRKIQVRVVSMEKPWAYHTGFFGEAILQVSEKNEPLAVLAKAIESNPAACRALLDFLQSIDGKANG